MLRIAAASLLVFLCAFAYAHAGDADAMQPTGEDRAAIDACLKRTLGQDTLKRIAQCVGASGDRCDGNTYELVSCNMRQQKVWDGLLNQWYAAAIKRLGENDDGEQAALRKAQAAWIAYRDAKCDFWEKRYEGGTFASVATGNCMREETGIRALEIYDVLNEVDR